MTAADLLAEHHKDATIATLTYALKLVSESALVHPLDNLTYLIDYRAVDAVRKALKEVGT